MAGKPGPRLNEDGFPSGFYFKMDRRLAEAMFLHCARSDMDMKLVAAIAVKDYLVKRGLYGEDAKRRSTN